MPRVGFCLAFVLLFAACGGEALGGLPPPAYTDPSGTITNALGGVGFTAGWNITDLDGATSGSIDALDPDVGPPVPPALTQGSQGTANAASIRTITVKLINSPDLDDAICVQLGDSLDQQHAGGHPQSALECTLGSTSTGSSGGMLVSKGDIWQVTLRPKASGCTSWATCHQPVYVASIDQTPTTEPVINVEVAF